MSKEAAIKIRCSIDFGGTAPDLARALVFVQIHDVTRADAQSILVAEQTAKGKGAKLDGGRLLVDVQVPDNLPAAKRYSFRVHVSVSGSRTVRAGDSITMESFPYSPQDPNQPYVLVVRPVSS